MRGPSRQEGHPELRASPPPKCETPCLHATSAFLLKLFCKPTRRAISSTPRAVLHRLCILAEHHWFDSLGDALFALSRCRGLDHRVLAPFAPGCAAAVPWARSTVLAAVLAARRASWCCCSSPWLKGPILDHFLFFWSPCQELRQAGSPQSLLNKAGSS